MLGRAHMERTDFINLTKRRIEKDDASIQRNEGYIEDIVDRMCSKIAADLGGDGHEGGHGGDFIRTAAATALGGMGAKYYRSYEVYLREDKGERFLTFSVEIPPSDTSPKDAVQASTNDATMMREVADFLRYYYARGDGRKRDRIFNAAETVTKGGADAAAVDGWGQEVQTGAAIGMASRAPREMATRAFKSFFREFVARGNGSMGGDPRRARMYASELGSTTVHCSSLAASHEPRVHEAGVADEIETCNLICGIICNGAVVNNQNGDLMLVRQTVAIRGSQSPMGVESFYSTTFHGGTPTGGDDYTIREVQLPSYVGAAGVVRMGWYAAARRCMELQRDYVHSMQANHAVTPGNFHMSVVRPSRNLLYAILSADYTSERGGAPMRVRTYFTLGTPHIGHVRPPGGWGAHAPQRQGQPSGYTKPLYKVFAQLYGLYHKPLRNDHSNFPSFQGAVGAEDKKKDRRGMGRVKLPRGGGRETRRGQGLAGGESRPRGKKNKNWRRWGFEADGEGAQDESAKHPHASGPGEVKNPRQKRGVRPETKEQGDSDLSQEGTHDPNPDETSPVPWGDRPDEPQEARIGIGPARTLQALHAHLASSRGASASAVPGGAALRAAHCARHIGALEPRPQRGDHGT